MSAVPHLLDLGERLRRPFGERGLGEPCRHADAERAGQELEQRPAPCRVEPVEPAGEQRRNLHWLAPTAPSRRWSASRSGSAVSVLAGPDQRDRLGGVAHIVAGQIEQHGIDARREHLGQDAAKRQPEEQSVGERGERVAAVGIGRGREIVGKQPELVVARRRVRRAGREARRRPSLVLVLAADQASARPLRPVVWI